MVADDDLAARGQLAKEENLRCIVFRPRPVRRASYNVQHTGAAAVDRHRAEGLEALLHHKDGKVGSVFLLS